MWRHDGADHFARIFTGARRRSRSQILDQLRGRSSRLVGIPRYSHRRHGRSQHIHGNLVSPFVRSFAHSKRTPPFFRRRWSPPAYQVQDYGPSQMSSGTRAPDGCAAGGCGGTGHVLSRPTSLGPGHRIYKVKDPRATILQKVVRGLAEEYGPSRCLISPKKSNEWGRNCSTRRASTPMSISTQECFIRPWALILISSPPYLRWPEFQGGWLIGWNRLRTISSFARTRFMKDRMAELMSPLIIGGKDCREVFPAGLETKRDSAPFCAIVNAWDGGTPSSIQF